MLALFAIAALQTVEPAAPDLAQCVGTPGPVIENSLVSLPAVGVEREVEVGQGMIASYRHQIHEGGLALQSPVTFRGRYLFVPFTVTVQPGALEPTTFGRDAVFAASDYTFRFATELGPRTFGRADVAFVPDPANPSGLIAHVSHGGSRQRYPIPTASFSTAQCFTVGVDSFRRELIYGGVSQGTISIEYREFNNDMARPAFSQTLRYDLNEGREIGFRGARFEIIDANNVSVRFRVVRPLSEQ